MPNWCNNSITLKHRDPAMIQRAQEALAAGTLLNEFIPVPQVLLDTVSGFVGSDKEAEHEAQKKANIEQFGYPDWYSFCVNEWGTKWDVGSNGHLERLDPNTLTASFDSAWSPPTQAYEKLSDMGFEIEAYYFEPGMGFAGTFIDGIDDCISDISTLSADQVRELYPELDERFGISDMIDDWEAENAEE